MARCLRRRGHQCGERAISQLTFHIRAGAKFKRPSTRGSAATVVRTRRRWSGEIGHVLGFRRRRSSLVRAKAQMKETAS